jgi:Uma2 family endonuclease
MAAGTTPVSVEDYLRTSYKPTCEYVDGVLHQKPVPTWMHGLLQAHLAMLINQGFHDFVAASEVNVRIRTEKYFVPDLIVQRRDWIQSPYPTSPVHLCAEVLSPEDRMSEVLAKCEEYHAWGVETTWIVDPETRRAWQYQRGQRPAEVPAAGALQADGISIRLADVMAVLAGPNC